MIDKKFIEGVKLTNFRCLPDGYIGPFASFNLIYGRNGSGKTSLFEALELALTGTSFRYGVSDDYRDTLAREKEKPIQINLHGPENFIGSFIDGRLTPRANKILKLLYGIITDGRKARFLIRQFFTTHSILYAERVIRFLEAEEKSQLNSVLSESTLGRDVLDAWSYIEEASKNITLILDELSTNCDQLRSQITEIQNSLQAATQESEDRFLTLAKQLRTDLSDILRERSFKKEPTIGADLSEGLRNLVAALKDAEDHSNNLKTFVEIHKGATIWNEFSEEIEQAFEKKKEIEAKIEQIDESLEGIYEKISTLEKDEQEISRVVERLQGQKQTLTEALDKLSRILDWIPELSAQERTEILSNDINFHKKRLTILKQAIQIFQNLPSAGELQALNEEITKQGLKIEEVKSKVQSIESQRNRTQSEIARVEQVISSIQGDLDRSGSLLTQIHKQVEEFIGLRSEAICPTCGHPWESVQELKKSIYRHYEFLKGNLGPKAEEASRIGANRVDLQTALTNLDRSEQAEQTHLRQLLGNLEEMQSKQNRIQASKNELFSLLNELQLAPEGMKPLAGIEDPSGLNKEILDKNIRGEEDKLVRSEASYSRIWFNLRKDDFENKKSNLITDLHFLRERCSDLGILLPTTWEIQNWTDSLAVLRNKMTALGASHQDNAESLANAVRLKIELVAERETLQTQKHDYHDEYDRISKRLDEWITARGHVQTLHGYGFFEAPAEGDTTRLYDRVKQLRLRADALSEELNFLLKEQAVGFNLEASLGKKQEELRKIIRRRDVAQTIQTKIRKVSPAINIQESVWKDYDEIISLLFRKLHWPPDFSRVRLKVKTDEIDLEIESRRKPNEWNPAHKRLSAGQRSALALSVFWAFNVLPEIIPPILVMDEPIQNIDELNALNFLDGLRWLVEGANRQVFLTTANQRVAGLIRRKFSYLETDFLELRLKRDGIVSSIEYRDAQEKPIEHREIARG